MNQIKRFINQLPESNSDVRHALYKGEIYLLPANSATRSFVKSVMELVRNDLGDNFRQAHEVYQDTDYFTKIGKLRKRIYSSVDFHEHVNQVIQSFGFDLKQQAYDPARLRVIAHNGHLNPDAAPMYYGHRDTWYSNSQSMITWWIPLHDVIAEETFEFYPEYFSCIVQNNSEIFDFDEWVSDGQAKRIGWQKKETGRTAGYPELQETPQGVRIPVSANAGDLLLFSAQHLHQTLHNLTGQTRFSLDFRTVDLVDLENKVEALNVDNRSTGSSVSQFVLPEHHRKEKSE